ncbi:MAG: hypothetical protein IJO79_05515 [Firmicutes bacterium]|nr:hypothetical protein [Bacillota bacterium]
MIVPLVILSVTGLLSVNIQLYTDARDQAMEHVESRANGESLAFDEVKLLRSLSPACGGAVSEAD